MRFDTGGQDQKRKKWHLGARLRGEFSIAKLHLCARGTGLRAEQISIISPLPTACNRYGEGRTTPAK
jgi:hypothetical protein